MDLKAYAKINLILDVNKKLENGYHDISFLMTTLDLYDEVNIQKYEVNEVIVVNNKKLSNENNLAYKAITLMQQNFNIKNNYKVTIKKNIPIAAGMAGGSTDAAAVINGINEMESLNLNKEQLINIGIKLGADVPFCMFSKLAYVTGIGEKVEFVNQTIPSSNVLMINSGNSLSTKEVYENHNIEQIQDEDIKQILANKNYEDFYGKLRNSLQKTAFILDDEVKGLYDQIKKENKVTKVMISGSGPTLLVFDDDINKLKVLKDKYKSKYKYVDIYKVNDNKK